MKATTLPTISIMMLSEVAQVVPTAWSPMKSSSRSSPVAAAMVGTARKKENSAARRRVSFWLMPPTMVAMLRLVPGIMEKHWMIPMLKARRSVILLSSLPLLNILSQKSMNTPPTTSITGTIQMAFSGVSMKSIMPLFFTTKPITPVGMKATMSSQ